MFMTAIQLVFSNGVKSPLFDTEVKKADQQFSTYNVTSQSMIIKAQVESTSSSIASLAIGIPAGSKFFDKGSKAKCNEETRVVSSN